MSADPSLCELCQQEGGRSLWRDELLRVVAVEDADYAGFCRVILNRHIREMSELSAAERRRVMDAVFVTEEALRRLMQPHKINLASLGNLVPHVHWHIVPRFADDPHFPSPIWGTRVREAAKRAPPDWEAIRMQIAQGQAEAAHG